MEPLSRMGKGWGYPICFTQLFPVREKIPLWEGVTNKVTLGFFSKSTSFATESWTHPTLQEHTNFPMRLFLFTLYIYIYIKWMVVSSLCWCVGTEGIESCKLWWVHVSGERRWWLFGGIVVYNERRDYRVIRSENEAEACSRRSS